ncbi:MAG: phenylacetate--CoA ligase family protein [Candidatus Baldrarchaeia archaeon]
MEYAERIPRKELRELQNKRLRHIVKLAYEKSRTYHYKFKEAGVHPDDIKTVEDLPKLPFSSKDDYARDFRGVICDDKIAVWHTTSGTTGLPTIVGFTANDVEVQTSLEARNLRVIGVTEKDIIHNTTPYGMFFAGICLHEGARKIGATVIPAGKMPTAKQHVWLVELFNPTVILGIPQFILKLSYVYEEVTGKDPAKSSIRLIYALGEPLPDTVRKRLEDRWGAEVRIGYGLTEAGSGAECEEKNGVHWPEDHTLVEVVDPKTGEPVGEGEEGELVYTTMTRTGSVAIRFRSRDLSRVILDECSCGRTLVRVLPPKYRKDDLIKIRGTLTSPYAIDRAIFAHPEIRNYLCVIEKDERGVTDILKVYIESEKEDPRIIMDLAQKLGGGICVTPNFIKFVPIGSIPEIGRKGKRVIDLRVENPYEDIVREFMKKFDKQ